MDQDVEINEVAESTMASCRGCCSKMQTNFEEYCSRSSLHGLQYIGDQRTPKLERIIWVCVWIASVTICGILIGRVYEKWEMSPVIVSLAPTETPIWKIPFPAVTVCDNTRARASVFNYADVERRMEDGEPMTDQQRRYYNLLVLTCPDKQSDGDDDVVNATAARTLMELGTSMTSLISQATYMKSRSRDFFHPRLTQEGVCYTFNMLDSADFYADEVWIDPVFNKTDQPSNWTISDQYSPGSSIMTFPYRALLPGADFGLTIHLKHIAEEEGFVCGGKEPGFKIMLHNPGELPAVNTRFLDVPLNTQLNVAVAPNMILTSDNLKNYKPERRECYFPTDRPLRYYREYTQSKCRFECQTNYTLLKCGCVAFYMPMELLAQELQKLEKNLGDMKEEFDDPCMPMCSELHYDVETASNVLDMSRYLEFEESHANVTPSVSIVKIYFKVDQFIVSQRSELFGITEFIAYSGGLLGLFLGFSLLSLCEIAYFMSLRAAHALCRPRSPKTYAVE